MGEMLSLLFMQRALAAGLLVSLLCGLLSVFVILKRLSFIGVGLSHSAFAGVALGFLLGLDPGWTAVVYSVLVALLIGWIKQRGAVPEDTAIGIFFAANMALGVLLIGLSRRYNLDLFGYLFGNILAITAADLRMIAIAGAAAALVLALFFKEFLFGAFDEETAAVMGVPTAAMNYLLLATMALVTVLAIKVVGIVLVSALLVIPGAIGRRLAANYRGMALISVLAGALASVGGLLLAYRLDLPAGAAIVLLATLFFGLSLLKR
ncbi:MAG TPA: metal ABC transporter permease [bacterium]|uniref:High-affinity zinc uptake system membrane protein ZnuB n=1 Tax=candidate division TA06 bacterium ADurb.Bin417 TaxID=1852828 RepID=A0A1V5MER8_UNCT6|nr:MAG: High-affinity zinc uptake system membrane protein ZnuB [candidate division TA06 bacterium ADurb.Bin417]HNQ34789.1 metal ABC transporter permease [bacterium]HNS48385.1 metal ABC transporter permease [bacterium]